MSHVTSLCPHVTFYKTLTSLSTVFIKGHIELLQLLKWPCHTSFFTHIEPLRSIGSDTQDKNLVGSLDRFANKTADLRDLVNSV